MAHTTPLDGIESYLWGKLNEFSDYDWRTLHPAKTAEHLWYEEGWEMVHHIKSRFFECSSSHGNRWPFAINGELDADRRLFNVRCGVDGCEGWSECIINEIEAEKRIPNERYDGEWIRLPDAPVFRCYPHYWEMQHGEKYVPPTTEEILRDEARWRAMERMLQERPPSSLTIDCGIKIDSHVMMDESYLRRLSELMEEEYEHAKAQVC